MTENTTETKTEAPKTEAAAPATPKENPLNKLKPLLSLEPIFWNKLGDKVKAHIKPLYYALLVIFVFLFIGAFNSASVGTFFFNLIIYSILFVIVRLFVELVANNK